MKVLAVFGFYGKQKGTKNLVTSSEIDHTRNLFLYIKSTTNTVVTHSSEEMPQMFSTNVQHVRIFTLTYCETDVSTN